VIERGDDAGPGASPSVSGRTSSPRDLQARARSAGGGGAYESGLPGGSSVSCTSPAFRPYTSVDVVAAGWAGAYKNVLALRSGCGGARLAATTTASDPRGLAENARRLLRWRCTPTSDLMWPPGSETFAATGSSPALPSTAPSARSSARVTTEEIVARPVRSRRGASRARPRGTPEAASRAIASTEPSSTGG